MKEKMESGRAGFTSRVGYVLAAAGASVGLGNIWRFPYLAAKYGGGIFLLIYIIFAVTLGYTLLISETSLGRMTRKSPVGAYAHFGKSAPYRFGGWINALIPMLIVPYYSVIGGWVLYYLFSYITKSTGTIAGEGYFSSFIGDGKTVEFWFVIFALCTLTAIYFGVQKGIERVCHFLMPALVILAITVAVYSVTRPGALAGVRYLLVPDLKNFSGMTIVTAIGQMFYSLSCAMGILITFGSYMKKDASIEKSTFQVEFFDTAVAILAGLMIIPAVFAFSGDKAAENLQQGPSLMFISMPQVFDSMGMGKVIGILFFLLVFFAAVTSSIALAESCVSTVEDELHMKRSRAVILVGIIMIALGTLSSLGFNVLSGITILGMDFLDFFDFLTNSLMMPIAAMATCILVLRKITVERIAEEVTVGGAPFRWKKVYRFVLRYLSILCIGVILVTSVLNVLGIIHM